MPGNSGGAGVDRRRFLTISGTVLGGIAAGSTVVAAESSERFIVDTSSTSVDELEDAVEVVHDLSEIGVAVVRGRAGDLEGVTTDFEPDSVYALDQPADAVPVEDEAEASDAAYYDLQWDKQVQDVPSAHEVTEGEGTRVSVIDTGVDPTHPDLADAVNTELSANFTDDGGDFTDSGYHGTHVSGIVASQGLGTIGTAPATDLVACRVFSDEGGASFGDILAAIVHSVAIGSDVANLSLGAYPVSRKGLGSFYGKVLNRATTFANKEGTLLVVAAGNDSADLQHDGSVISTPNEAANVLSVSATGPIGFGWGDPGLREPATTPANYTNYGTNAIDVSAPGGNYDPDAIGSGQPWYYDLVINTIPGGWAWVAGTSMAAPQVTGAAALVKSENPNYNANQVRQTLERTADRVGDKAYHGSGFLNPVDAVQD
ncbi:peptidase S8 and S53 subtilisin kexin sedolisin [Halobacteriales archaeon QS_1_68_20]|nr:MAG: peptidase S8 and S53 subtilisin kexin sedolisin [Halobacteriales archaeon QS_1_68_20]